MAIITFIMTVAVLAVSALSCISDVRSLRIPNWHSLAVLGFFFPAWLASPEAFGGIWQHMAAMGIMFAVTYTMFILGMMGGGDSKLGTALGLWAGLKGLLPFIFYMSIMGGILGLLSFVLRKKKFFKNPKPGSWVGQLQEGRSAIPYGIAISFGAWAAFLYTGFVHNQMSEVLKLIH